MEEPTDFDGIYAKVKAMRVSEIKAELDLRKISYVGLFEKEELTWRCPKCKMNKPNEEWSDDQKRTTKARSAAGARRAFR